MSTENTPLSALVRDRRVELGMSQADLAEAVGKSQEWVSKIESGEIKYPRRTTIERMSFALRLSFTDLYIAAGYAVTRADANRIAESPGGTERTIGNRVDDVFDTLSAGERASIEAIVKTAERARRKSR